MSKSSKTLGHQVELATNRARRALDESKIHKLREQQIDAGRHSPKGEALQIEILKLMQDEADHPVRGKTS